MYKFVHTQLKKGYKYIKIIIVLSSLALVGLICIQAYWMNNAIKQRKVQFQESIQISMHEIVQGVEKYETLKKAERNGSLQKLLGYSDIGVDFFNNLSEDLKLQDSILFELQKQIKSAWNEQSNMMKSFVSDLISLDFFADIEDRIPKKDLENIIYQTLIKKEVSTDIEYALITQNKKTYYSSTTDNSQLELLKNSNYSIRLFPDDLFNSDVFLSILIPNEDQFVLSSMWIMLVLSVLFLIEYLIALSSKLKITLVI